MVNEILKTDIPDDWDIKKLEPNVGFVRSGKRLPKGYYVTPIPTQHAHNCKRRHKQKRTLDYRQRE